MYNPRERYYERMNANQKRGLARRVGHKFADSIGGCSSNYRDQEIKMRRNYKRKPKSREKRDSEKCVCNYIINTDNSKGK